MRPPKKRVLLAAASVGAVGASLVIGNVAFAADASTIADIQGAAHVSALDGQSVTDIPGIVTAVGPEGLWIQSEKPDDDPATSDGIYVYTKDAPDAKTGDTVTVSGTVSEYRADDANLSITEITGPEVTVTGSGDLPEPVVIGPGGRVAPDVIHSTNPGDIEQDGKFDPEANAIDFYESMEGMLVRVSDSAVVGPSNSYGEMAVLPGGEGGMRTERGGVKYTAEDANTERLMLDSTIAERPTANVGDTLAGDVDGVLEGIRPQDRSELPPGTG